MVLFRMIGCHLQIFRIFGISNEMGRLHAFGLLRSHLTASPCSHVPLSWHSCVRSIRRRRFSVEKSHVPPRKPLDVMSEPEMMRHLMRSQRVWWYMGAVVLGSVGLVAFGPELKLGMSKHTAEVASRSLQDETLRGNTRELASQIVQTVLNDPKVLTQASEFLQRLVMLESTRKALMSFLLNTLKDPLTQIAVADLTKQTVMALLQDPATLRQVIALLQSTVADPQTKESLLMLLKQLLQDPEIHAHITLLFASTLQQEVVKQSVKTTLSEAIHEVLSQNDVQNHAKEFVSNVVQDQTVQAQSGDAIWSTVMYALTPAWLSWVWQRSFDTTPVEALVVAAAAEDHIKKTKPVKEPTQKNAH